VMAQEPLVFLFDFDNTLVDSDRFKVDLSEHLEQTFGQSGLDSFWSIHYEMRKLRGYADHLGTVQAFRNGREGNPAIMQLAAYLLDYPFAQRLYPKALQVIAHLSAFGLPVVFTEGDMVYQPRKLKASGVWDAVAGRVMIPLHKLNALAEMQERYPARHYVMIEDKPLLIAEMKTQMGEQLTTVLVRQGHYALRPEHQATTPPPDLTVEKISDLLDFDRSHFQMRSSAQSPRKV